jgi:hypothetical protein
MAMHHELRTMVGRFGTRLFEDSDTLRAALDDYMTEGTATGGEINLLVDAVRLGAFRQLQGMVSSGADPASAVAAAGQMLARERGSSDVTGSSWAVAALGFAADLVPEAEVQRYDATTRLAPGAGDGPTTVYPVRQPEQPGQPGQPQQQPGGQGGYGDQYGQAAGGQYGQQAGGQYGQPPGGQYGQPGGGQYGPPGQPGQPPYSAYGAPGYGGYTQPPKKKSKTLPILLAVGGVVALALIAVGLWLAFAGGGDDEEAYCDLYRDADQQFEDSDFTEMGSGSFEDLQSTVSEIRDVAPAEIEEDWATIETAFTDLEDILAEYDLTLDDLQRLTSGDSAGLTQEELTALGNELTEWGSSGDFEAAGDRIDEDAEQRCGIPADSEES